MPRSFPRTRTDLTVVHLDDECVVYDERTGDLHHLNVTATVVLDLCDGSSSIVEITSMLATGFGVPRDTVEPEVRGLIRRFRRAGLLDPAIDSTKRFVVSA